MTTDKTEETEQATDRTDSDVLEVEATEEPTVDSGDAEGVGTDDAPHREAARYRVRLRETEAERDALAEQVSGLQRQLVEQVLTGGVEVDGVLRRPSQPSDLFDYTETVPAGLFDTDGRVDLGAVAEALAGLATERPGLVVDVPPPVGPLVIPSVGAGDPTEIGDYGWGRFESVVQGRDR